MATGDNKLASFSQGSEEVYTLVCLPCHRDKITRPAQGFCIDCKEHLCQECVNHHKKPAPCRHHKLQSKDTMPSTQCLTDTPVNTGTTDNLITPCLHHNTKMTEFYCRDHKKTLCSICVALKHRTCSVDYIPDISDKMIDGPDYKHTMDRIDKLLQKCKTIISETSTNCNKSTDSLQEALQELENYRKIINERMDQLEQDIEAKIQTIRNEKDERRTTVTTICEDIIKMAKVTYDCIKQLNTSNQANQLFMEVKQAQKQLEGYEESIQSLSAEDGSIDEYKFIPNLAISDVLQTEEMIGEISPKHQLRAGSASQSNPLPSSVGSSSQSNPLLHSAGSYSQSNPLPSSVGSSSPCNIQLSSVDDTITPTCQGEIYVKSSQDKRICWISGMTMLPQDRLVLADRENNSMKLVDVNSKSIISQLSLGTEITDAPWDITSTTSTQVAVTVPGRQRIQFISVRKPSLSASDKLSKSHTIQTDGACYGIRCHQDKLIVTYQYPGKLEILDMKGRVITTVKTDSTGRDIFTGSVYVQANSRSIYVADWKATRVIMLNWNGEITGRITDIAFPIGLALLHDGSLLVCDRGPDRVYQVAGDGTNSRIILQHVGCPLAVCVDDGGHKIYISTLSCKNIPDNNILIYNI